MHFSNMDIESGAEIIEHKKHVRVDNKIYVTIA